MYKSKFLLSFMELHFLTSLNILQNYDFVTIFLKIVYYATREWISEARLKNLIQSDFVWTVDDVSYDERHSIFYNLTSGNSRLKRLKCFGSLMIIFGKNRGQAVSKGEKSQKSVLRPTGNLDVSLSTNRIEDSWVSWFVMIWITFCLC